MNKLFNYCYRFMFALLLISQTYAADTAVWPFDERTNVSEFTVIFLGPIAVEPSGASPDFLKRHHTYSLTVIKPLKTELLPQKFYAFISEAKPVEAQECDYTWGITLRTKEGAIQEFFVSYRGNEAIAKLGNEFFKLNLVKTKAFLSQFNAVFGCNVE